MEKPSKIKEGKTLIVKNLEDTVYEKISNLKSNFVARSGNHFLVFNSINESKIAYDLIESYNYQVKYSYYKVFMKIVNDNISNLDYNELKTNIINKLKVLIPELNILYFRFYTKDRKLIGSGDFTIDCKEDLSKLIDINKCDIDDNTSISVYRFRNKQFKIE